MLYVMKKDKSTKKIAYSAVLVAISVVVILISAFTPMQIVPLVFVSLAIYISFGRVGIGYGVITTVATVALAFFITGLGTTFFFLVILFVPYALLASAMQKLSYKVLWQAILRLAVTAITFCGAFFALTAMVDVVAGTSILAVIDKVGKILTALLVVVATLPVDFFFTYIANRIIRFMK
jgi:hypothetical protein